MGDRRRMQMLPTIWLLAFSASFLLSSGNTHFNANSIPKFDSCLLIAGTKLLDDAYAFVPSNLAGLSGIWNCTACYRPGSPQTR
jgi:hypothetical protein